MVIMQNSEPGKYDQVYIFSSSLIWFSLCIREAPQKNIFLVVRH